MKANLHETNRKFWLSAAIGLALLFVTATPRTARAQQWTNNGNNISNTNTGNVGVGTTTPGYRLDVLVNAPWVARFKKTDATNGGIIIDAAAGYNPNVALAVNGTNKWFMHSNSGSSDALQFLDSSGTARFTFTQAGNVGIGTTAPPTKLSLQPAAYSSAVDGIEFTSSDNTTHSIIQPIKIAAGAMNLYLGSNSYIDTAGVIARFNASAANASINVRSSDGTIRFDTNTSGGSVLERMQIDAAGKVGIGTTTPVAQLDVRTGTVALPPGGGIDPNVYHTWFPFSDGKNYIRGTTIIADQGGNVGIGVASPAFKLEVAGEIRSTTIGGVGGFRFPDGTLQTTAAGGGVTSVFGRTGAVVAATNDYTWAQINKTTSSLADLTTRSAGDLSSGTVATARLGSGTANTTTFLRGDNTWAVPSGATQWNNGSNSIISYSGGYVGIGMNAPSEQLEVSGNLKLSGTGNITAAGTIEAFNIKAKYQDMAEWVPSSEPISSGTVVVLDANKSNHVVSSGRAYDTRVAGVISEQPGISLGESGTGKVLVATTGRVLVQVDSSKSPIHIGDLLVTSDVPGVAMKSEPVNLGGVQLHRPGTLIGKALEPLEKGKGKILVLLSLQ